MQKRPILIFDWDGVVVSSNDWKWRDMWPEIFPNDEEKVKKAVEILSTPEGRGLNRVGLIKKIFSDNIDEKELENILTRFSSVVINGISKLGFFYGVENVLSDLKSKGYSIYVITGTAQTDVLKVANHIGAEKFFKDILGFIPSKDEGRAINKYDNFLKVRELEGTKDPKDFVVIGDGDSNFNLAKKIGCDFIAIPNEWNGWAEDPQMRPLLVQDTKGVPDRIRELFS